MINPAEPLAVSGEYIFPNNTPVTFWHDEISRSWVTSDITLPYTHKVNREKSNLVRKSYANFRRYLSGIIKLRTETRETPYWGGGTKTEHLILVTKEELSSHGFASNHSATHIRFNKASTGLAREARDYMLSTDPNDNYKAFLHIIRSVYGYGFIPHQGIGVYTKDIMPFLNKLLLFIHKNEVLERVSNETAKAKRDPYGAWFE
jgi:hypothetical protein